MMVVFQAAHSVWTRRAPVIVPSAEIWTADFVHYEQWRKIYLMVKVIVRGAERPRCRGVTVHRAPAAPLAGRKPHVAA